MTLTDVKIRVPEDMTSYIIPSDSKAELVRNAMVLYPYINNMTISHGRAAEILGIREYELIEIYDKLGLPYLDKDIEEIEQEVSYWRSLKEVRV